MIFGLVVSNMLVVSYFYISYTLCNLIYYLDYFDYSEFNVNKKNYNLIKINNFIKIKNNPLFRSFINDKIHELTHIKIE